jgi:hypothetical protein
MALWEGRVMDAQLGMMLNPGFGDYKLPGSLEMPEMVPLIDDDDKREAVIGIAEGCIIPAVGALVNAVFNATACACARCRHARQDSDGLMKPTVLSADKRIEEKMKHLNGQSGNMSTSGEDARGSSPATSTRRRDRLRAGRIC